MRRRDTLRRAAIALAALAAAFSMPGVRAAADDPVPAEQAAAVEKPTAPADRSWKPNIVLIVIDTLRADALPFYSDQGAVAPHLSTLAATGVVFDKVWSTASSTAPATASLFTSLDPEDHGVVVGHLATKKVQRMVDSTITLNRIPDEALTLGEVMKSAGYRTFGLSDNYNASTEMGFAQGFDRFESNPRWYWGAEEMARRLVNWQKKITGAGPYFLYIHFIDPHSPYHKRPRWYRGVTSTVSESGEPLSGKRLHSMERRATYLSEVGYLDEEIRKLHKRFGWDRNTLIIVTADHGEEFGDHGGKGHGKTLYEEVLRIPLVVHDTTGRFGRGRVTEQVSILDILPTLGEMVGASLDGRMQGRSLVPLLEAAGGGSDPPAWPVQRALFGHIENHLFHAVQKEPGRRVVEYEWHVSNSAVRGRWKLIRDSRGEAQLFDLAADPGEKTDRVNQSPEVAAELDALLRSFLARDKVFPPERFEKKLSPEELERLRTLGYVE